jgi:hypothetical protein
MFITVRASAHKAARRSCWGLPFIAFWPKSRVFEEVGMRKGLFLTAAVFALAAGQANAGVVITSKHTELDTQMSDTVMVYLDADRMKVVAPDATVIFRGDQNKVWILQPEQKSYMEMTPETMRNMGTRMAGAQAQMNAAMAQMQAQMAQMPPEQRAMMEQMMAGRGGLGGPPPGRGPGGGAAAAAARATFAKGAGGKTVGSWRCENYLKSTGGRKDEDLCIAPIAAMGLTAADFRVMENFAKFMEPMTSSPMMGQRTEYMDWNEMNAAIGFQGIPLDTITYSGGKPSLQETVQKIDRANIPANTFELPAGLTKRDMGMPPR